MKKFVIKNEKGQYLTGNGKNGGVSDDPKDAQPYMDGSKAAAVALAVTSVTTSTYRVVEL